MHLLRGTLCEYIVFVALVLVARQAYILVVAPRWAGSKGNEFITNTMMSNTKNQNSNSQPKRKLVDDSSEDEGHQVKMLNMTSDSFAKFIVLSSLDEEKPLTKMSPFAINKTIQATAGEVKKVTKMKNGSLLVECTRQQQSRNLLSLTSILENPISATPHRTLNSSQGIVRDRDRDLKDMSEEEICKKLESQNITKVKRFTKKIDHEIVKLNTYLLTFGTSKAPDYIYIGPYRIKVDTYVPNPTRCFKCQKFGHGKGSCRGTERCVKCSDHGHSSFECEGEIKCSNCGLKHMANSRSCEIYKKEMEIQKLKTERNISYQEAKNILSVSNNTPSTNSYADVAKDKPSTNTIEIQTVFTWPINSELPELLSEFLRNKTNVSHSSTSSQTSETNNQFPSKGMVLADIYAGTEVERRFHEDCRRKMSTSSKKCF